jgi:polyhydroxyalkanoate synthesis regulator phasin
MTNKTTITQEEFDKKVEEQMKEFKDWMLEVFRQSHIETLKEKYDIK